MPKTVSVPLEGSITTHQGPVSTLTLREPMYDDIMGVGHPYTVHEAEGGQSVVIYDHAAIRHYAEACVQAPVTALHLSQLGMRDTFALRRAVLSFFLPSAAAGADSKTSRESSGAPSDSSQTPSAE